MRIGLLGGLRVEHDGRSVPVVGAMQLAVLFRLAVDAGVSVSYRAISEDIWGLDAPENTKAALQSIVSRLRSQLPPGSIESTVGGYRLAIARADVDALEFTDRVAAAAASDSSAELASDALALWSGEPWTPSDNFDWFVRDLRRDHARAVELGGSRQRAKAASDLPAQLTGLVGREVELGMIADQLAGNRLVTIIGTGGAGKTRLAIEAASARSSAILVELAPVGPGEVLAAILAATGREIRVLEGAVEVGNTRNRVLDALAGRDILLVLDNCEHVIAAAATIVQDLLSSLPQLRVLATSREPLGVPGESFVLLGSLAHPTDAGIESMSAAELCTYAAIELFCERGASARGAAPGTDELAAVARICARLDGLPLAIELAAAKLRTMSVDEVLAGLDDRFSLLTGGYRTALPRHQTLRAMIDWSWSLLDDHERGALLQFAVFPAGVSAADSKLLAEQLGMRDVRVFDSLVDRSLLQRIRGRFRALETVREYGIDRLSESGGVAAARRLQAEFVAAQAEDRDRQLRGARIMDALAWFDAEEDNLTSALRYATSVPLAELSVRLAVSCTWYWVVRDRNEDAQDWFARISPLAESVQTRQAQLLFQVGKLASKAGELMPDGGGAEAPPELRELVEPLREFRFSAGEHDLLQLIEPVSTAFVAALAAKKPMSAVEFPDPEALGLDKWPTAMLHIAHAAMAQNNGDLATLGVESEKALRLFEEQGDIWGVALSEQMHSIWLAAIGRLEEALELSDRSTGHMRDITTNWDLAQQQGLAIQMLVRLGRRDEAIERVTTMLEDARSGAIGRTLLQAHLTAASVAIQLEDFALAGTSVAEIEDARGAWHGEPPQITAMIDAIYAAIAIHHGDFDAAEGRLRDAAEKAVRSLDHPVIGMVAIAVGSWALARGEIEAAVRAVDFSTAMVGAYDATNPSVIAIAEAAEKHGIGRPSTEVPERPIGLTELQELLSP